MGYAMYEARLSGKHTMMVWTNLRKAYKCDAWANFTCFNCEISSLLDSAFSLEERTTNQIPLHNSFGLKLFKKRKLYSIVSFLPISTYTQSGCGRTGTATGRLQDGTWCDWPAHCNSPCYITECGSPYAFRACSLSDLL